MTKFDNLLLEENKERQTKTRENRPRIADGNLYKEVSLDTGYSQKEVAEICSSLFKLVLYEVFQVGNRVSFRNFGTFWQRENKANNNALSKVNHTRAKDPKAIKANGKNYVLTFKMSKNLRQRTAEIRRKD